MRPSLCLLVVATLGGCGEKRTQIQIGPPPPRMTTGTLAGSLCSDGQCKCRQGNEDAGLPQDGRKRFEIRLKSAYELWVTLPGTVLYKSPERAEACFYVDLSPGQHPVQLRASNKDGVSVALEIHELGTKTKSWYQTFEFACGHPGVCTYDDLDTKKAEYASIKQGKHDPCGSTRIKSVMWDHGKSPDKLYPSELAVALTLDVYKFVPWKPTGDATCGEGGGRRAPGEGGDDGGEQPESP
ncbi:MAG TPA: hypothetical protein VFQ53_00175 [Kofleriaceae bacterium]|nr:hypothetical protein [Kofleriaceae bacterium]